MATARQPVLPQPAARRGDIVRAEVEAYLDQAARAIEEARYLLSGGYWDAAVTRAY